MDKEVKQEVLRTVKRCIDNDMLQDDTIKEINSLLIEDLSGQIEPKINPDDLGREVDPSCESGICGAR